MTVDELLAEFRAEAHRERRVDYAALRTRLLEREDNMADFIRLAGAQFGLFPEIVSKVLLDCGLGTPPSDEVRAMVNHQFIERLNWIAQQQQGDG